MPATDPKPPRPAASFADLNAVIERVAPDLVRLLADGVPRSRAAIVATLADRHDKQDVKRTLMRLSVTGRLALVGAKFVLPPPDEPAQD